MIMSAAREHPLIAMDTWFAMAGECDIETRCKKLVAAGIDGLLPSLSSAEALQELPRTLAACRQNGLQVPGVFAIYDAGLPPEAEGNRLVFELIARMEDCPVVQLAIQMSGGQFAASDPAGDDAACRAIEGLLAAAEKFNRTIALYPHIWFWMERHSDAMRLRDRIAHPRLKLVFCAMHWFEVDGENLGEQLKTMAPHLVSANLSGHTKLPAGTQGLPVTIEPIYSGELNCAEVYAQLFASGYRGHIAIQGYSITGDIFEKLRKSKQAFLEMRDSLPARSP